MKKAMTGAHVAEKLGLGDVQLAWLAKLGEARPSADLPVPNPDALTVLLARLSVARSMLT